jgi:hydrogenase nickel incorporation protein HypA/HybF
MSHDGNKHSAHCDGRSAKAQVSAVTQVCLCIGDLAGVEATTLTACFEMLSEGTVADKARLIIKRIPATGTCTVCGAEAIGRRQNAQVPLVQDKLCEAGHRT